MSLSAEIILREAIEKNNIHLSVLIAETALWADPAVHRILIVENGTGCFFPNTRRSKLGQGEKRTGVVGSIRLDNNAYANHAIKQSIGLGRSAVGFEACHIWPNSCYDERYYTVIANLVLIPRALASLSDHSTEVRQVLQYRAFELYTWYPMEHDEPKRPDFYPTNWRKPEPFTSRVAKSNSLSQGSNGCHRKLSCFPKTASEVGGVVAGSQICGRSRAGSTCWRCSASVIDTWGIMIGA